MSSYLFFFFNNPDLGCADQLYDFTDAGTSPTNDPCYVDGNGQVDAGDILSILSSRDTAATGPDNLPMRMVMA